MNNEWVRIAAFIFALLLMTSGAGAIAQAFKLPDLVSAILMILAMPILIGIMPEPVEYWYESQ